MAALTRAERLLSYVTRLRPGEGRAASLFFLHAFLLLSSLQMVKALREAFMLAKFSAETRSYAVAMMAVILMVVVPLYSRLRRRVDGAGLLRLVTLFFVVTLPLLAMLARQGISIAFAFYIWVGIYSVMVVSQMWAFAADSFNVKTGQRLFVLIALGANLGALAGARLTAALVTQLSPTGLMLLATCTIGATLLLATPERRAVPEGSRADPDERTALPPPPSLMGGIGLVLRDRYLLVIAIFIVLLNWINSTGEFILADFVKQHAVQAVGPDGDTSGFIAHFYGTFQFWVTLISLAIQLLLVSRVYQLVGVRGALLVHPIIVAVGYGVLALAPLLGGFIPVFSLIRRIKVADNGVDYSLMNTTRQALFLPVDRHSKYEGKMAIDTFFVRFGDLIQALCVFGGIHLFGWGSHQFAILTFGLALVWIALAVKMGNAHALKSSGGSSNSAPEVVETIPDLHCRPGQPFRHAISPGAFRDVDPGDVLVFRACCHDGKPLPRWVKFDVWKQTFYGTTPARLQITEIRISVIASDLDGATARSSFSLRPAR